MLEDALFAHLFSERALFAYLMWEQTLFAHAFLELALFAHLVWERALSAHLLTFTLSTYIVFYIVLYYRGHGRRVPSHQIEGIQTRKKDFGQKRKWGINK